MSSVRLRRVASIAVSATALLALSACGTGFGAQTNQQYDAGVGSNERDGQIDVLHALFVDNGDDTATFSASFLNQDDEAHILKSAKAETGTGEAIDLTFATPRELKPDQLFDPGPDGDIILTGPFPAGGFVKITFEFENSAPVTIDSPVVARSAIYTDVASKAVVPEPSAREKAAEEQEQDSTEEGTTEQEPAAE